MLRWIDWKGRFWAQEILNRLGLKFGVTRAGAVVNTMVLNLSLYGYSLFNDWPVPWGLQLIGGIVIILNILITWIMVYNLKRPKGEETNWMAWMWMRRFHIIILPVNFTFAMIGLAAGQWDWDSLFNWLYIISFNTAFWFSACIEPPAKKKRESKKTETGKLVPSYQGAGK